MPAIPSEVGPVFDLLLQTRDGSTLPCKNKDGKIVNVSAVAYCTSIDRQGQGQHEETEIQHRDQLVQLSSSNLIDREFNQWPQVSQGDWSGGMLQRVLTGSTPITSFGPQSDPTRYWDGTGILWPATDYLPQSAVLPSPISDSGGVVMTGMPGMGTTAGFINSIGESYAFVYMQSAAPNNIILVIQSSTTRNSLTNPAGPWAAGSAVAPADFFIGHGVLWYWWTDLTPNLNINFVTVGGPTVTSFATIAGGIATSGGIYAGSVGIAGNRRYLAVPYVTSGGALNIRLYDISTGSNTSFTDIPVGDQSVTLTSSAQFFVNQTCFLGDNLMISLRMGDDCNIIQYNIPSNTSSVVAHFPSEPTVYMAPVAGALFMTAQTALSPPNMYLLQGGSLQHVGSVVVQTGIQIARAATGVSKPQSFGPYAIFAVSYAIPGLTTTFVNVYAYDVLRGRIFRMANLSGLAQTMSQNISGTRLGSFYRVVRPLGATNVAMQWGVLVPTLSATTFPQDTTNVQECFVNVSSSPSTSPPLQSGTDIVSSLIDFTSAQNKLYRQIVATFSPLPNDAAITVQVQAWLDQDPANLSVNPDFTTGAVAAGMNGGAIGQTQLKLLINKVATKIVYRITTTGPSTALTPAVKLISVIVQAATGWVQTLKLDLAPNVQTNSKNGNVWDKQSTPGVPATDHVVAYNFLRQLWRLKGGEVALTLPNGDSGNWLIQDMAFDSPKPMAASFRADQQTTYQSIASIKIREDL